MDYVEEAMTLPRITQLFNFYELHPPAFVLLEKLAGHIPRRAVTASPVKEDVSDLGDMPGVVIKRGKPG